ncbi:UNVERIFIED_CONTAM: hypothetical protein GTU68_016617 [Idotea baltica]|nr:hypothetical protein [Idotea baltica]
MLRLVLILVIHCLLTNGQGPGPGPGGQRRCFKKDSMQSRAADKRVRFSVLEGQETGTFVGVIPLKPGYTYRFNEAPREFTLNGTTGEIRTTKILDREALDSDQFDLVVLSSQPTYPIEVRIAIIDINDNAPRFPEPSIHVSFSENANAGTRVILDTATDGDAGENDITTRYKIVSGNEDSKFHLVVTTNPSGETPYLHLETTEKLDRETVDTYQLNISAEDGGDPPHYGFLLVNVSILDVNDNSPTFDHSDYIVSLSESVPPGTFVLQVKATDVDVGENARLSYYLSETETQFSVDSETGVITTVEPLSCHRNCPQQTQCPKSCVFTVFARDHGSPRQDGRTYVTVNLQDANDHDPIVSFKYFSATAEFATVDENAQNGSVVAVVSVIDADEGLNGETTAEIRGGNELNHFRLDSKDSFDIVRVNAVLDREKISKYNVTIVSTDKGTPVRSSTAFLIIHVNDINDHEPVFEKSEYSAVLSELVPIGTYVAGITANDEDTGVNSNIYYDITSGNDNQWFSIDRESGLITTKAHLNREIKDSVDLKISARDGGPNPKRAYTYLKITILDENDERPTFTQPTINITLSENTTTNTLVALVSAIDRDRGTNGSVSYIFHEDVEHKYPGMFNLDSSNGRVTTKTKLDRETMPFYEIKIIAKDQGIPPLSSTATIYLEVQDVNDNSPEFYPQKYFVVVPEDLPLSSIVTQVTATDKDEGENAIITYELNSGDENDNTFEIDPKTGVLQLSGRLSRIKRSQYTLSVTVKDRGERKAIQDAVIDIVIESNDIEPLEFEKKGGYKFSIVEDAGKKEPATSHEVGKIVLGGDISVDKVNYAIISGDPDKVFSIDQHTGLIRTVKRIDREQTDIYFLEAVATTSSTYGNTKVNVTVKDVNDNPPKFPVRKATAYVAENWPVGHQVYLAKAHDPDDGVNSHITYRLTINIEDYFYISPRSGMIYLKKSVKYGVSNEFTLEVTATDGGTPSLSSKQIVNVFIEDVNDHTPIFEHESYETSLLESTPVNDRFFALTASDKDDGRNGFISYDITEGNDDMKFGIFPDGYLYVKSALDRETRDYFALTIIAKDHGEPSRSSTVSVVIHILDENDNPPTFTNSTFAFYLDENEPPDTYVGRLTATDLDKGRNAELTYTIAINQNGFVVDPKSGFLKTLHYFDREKLIQMTGQDYVTMEGVVLDNGVNKLKDKTKIVIYISDVNDNPPKFNRKSYRAEISEGAALNTQVVRITATDQDEGRNGDIFYSISIGNEEKHFKLDEVTGQVTLSHLLDRETISTYHLEIVASDLGYPKALSATTTLTIDVLDENDNVPQFILEDYEISVLENTEVNTILYQFHATDADLRMNKEISYIIGGGNIHETFHIDTKTGTLVLDRPLDYEQRNIYRLNITAADGASSRLTSSVSFIVKILDYNDNPPTFPNTAIVRQIQEGIPPKTAIVTVTADDPDSGANGKIKYTISHQDPPGNHFSIDEDTGVVKTLRDIDREFADTFRLTVVATDQALVKTDRLKAEKLVTVIVEDINDNAPLFVSMNAGILPVNAASGYEIMKILARDKDANSNGHVTYDLVDGATNIFTLERNGSLKLKRELSSSKIMYQVKVRATDEAVKQHIQFLDEQITILVFDSSQEGPQFSQNSYTGSVSEGTGLGTSVAVVSASLPTNSQLNVKYFVVNVTSAEGNPVDRVFDIQHGNVVSTASILDREDGPEKYIVTVAAVVTQGNTPRLSTTQASVQIWLLARPVTYTSSSGADHSFTLEEKRILKLKRESHSSKIMYPITVRGALYEAVKNTFKFWTSNKPSSYSTLPKKDHNSQQNCYTGQYRKELVRNPLWRLSASLSNKFHS